MSTIEKPTMKEILILEFMIPKLANDLDIDNELLESIICDGLPMDNDISRKLGNYFGVSSEYFLNIQNSIK